MLGMPEVDLRGRPRPGPGRRVMGFRVGSSFLGLSARAPLASAFCWARRRPWKCCLLGVSVGEVGSACGGQDTGLPAAFIGEAVAHGPHMIAYRRPFCTADDANVLDTEDGEEEVLVGFCGGD